MRVGAKPFLSLSLVWLLIVGHGSAQEIQPSDYEIKEYQLKAAFLFNFAKFVEWPPETFADQRSPIVIGILGDNPFRDESRDLLEETVRNKVINERPVVVKVVQAPAAATNCHILFISTSEKERLPEILAGLRGASVLTVGETERFTESGGMINFVLEGNKIRFQINDAAARSARLTVSSKLLSLALRPAS